MTHQRQEPIYIDAKGFVYIGQAKLPVKIDIRTRELEWFDKDPNRAAVRGSPYVRVPLDEFFTKLCHLITKGTNHEQQTQDHT